MSEFSWKLAESMRQFLDGDQSEEPGESEYKTKALVDIFNEALSGRQEKETEAGVEVWQSLNQTLRELGL